MKTIIRLEGISKKFKIYQSPFGRLREGLTLGRCKAHEDFWALRDIQLSVSEGETLGVIGMNGSGKSTLLQIMAGILRPTSGVVSAPQRIATLLELGGLFHPDLSGIENIFLAAGVLGYRRREIQERVEQIVSFADIGHFINRPVKIYSQGMFLRLAFSVAVCMNPDAVLIDEILAVGDIFFHQRCYDKITEFSKNGKAVLLVSHNTEEIKRLTDRCILLDRGKVVAEGNPWEVTEFYHKRLNEERLSNAQSNFMRSYKLQGESFFTDEVELRKIRLLRQGNEISGALNSGDDIEVEIDVEFKSSLKHPSIDVFITDLYGITIAGTSTAFKGISLKPEAGDFVKLRFEFSSLLKNDTYGVTVRVAENQADGHARSVMKINKAAVFEVTGSAKFYGMTDLFHSLEIFRGTT